MNSFRLYYTNEFSDSLENVISNWESLSLSQVKIQEYVEKIYEMVKSLKYFPNRYEDVTDLYGLKKHTRRILIGKEYAILYNVDLDQKTVYIGTIISQKQMYFKF